MFRHTKPTMPPVSVPKEKAQCRRSGNRSGDDRGADAHDLHDCRFGWAIACIQPLLGDAAYFTDRVRLNDNGAMDKSADAPVRTESGLRRSGLWEAAWGELSVRTPCWTASFPLFLVGAYFTGIYMSAQGFYRFDGGGHCVAWISTEGDIVCHGGRTRGGNSRAPAGQGHCGKFRRSVSRNLYRRDRGSI